jgi:hypothetical protein
VQTTGWLLNLGGTPLHSGSNAFGYIKTNPECLWGCRVAGYGC